MAFQHKLNSRGPTFGDATIDAAVAMGDARDPSFNSRAFVTLDKLLRLHISQHQPTQAAPLYIFMSNVIRYIITIFLGILISIISAHFVDVISVCVCACVRACVRAYVRTYVRACVRACMRACGGRGGGVVH